MFINNKSLKHRKWQLEHVSLILQNPNSNIIVSRLFTSKSPKGKMLLKILYGRLFHRSIYYIIE